jgi:ubiquinone/menaquinone biosynthesis C-methylase UbiE
MPDEDEERLRALADETRDNWREADYYDVAEGHIDQQWRDLIEPAIRDLDFRRVLELAPGHGRNTARLIELADELHLVDVNESCIERCRARFADHPRRDRLRLHVNDGLSLPMIADGSITLVYCWDAMVHFEPPVVRRYLAEFRRVLAPGGAGAVHYSNYGARTDAPQRGWRENPHWRSSMSQERFRAMCAELGLEIVREGLLDWDREPALDAVAVFVATPEG